MIRARLTPQKICRDDPSVILRRVRVERETSDIPGRPHVSLTRHLAPLVHLEEPTGPKPDAQRLQPEALQSWRAPGGHNEPSGSQSRAVTPTTATDFPARTTVVATVSAAEPPPSTTTS